MAKRQEENENWLDLDEYEVHILHRAIRLYLAVGTLDAEESADQNNPDYMERVEAQTRAASLKDRIDKLPALQPEDPCASGWRS